MTNPGIDYDLEREVNKALTDASGVVQYLSCPAHLLMALGCPHVVIDEDNTVVINPELKTEHENIGHYLHRLMTEPREKVYGSNQVGALLSGLNRYGGWRSVIQTDEGAYRLAHAILFCTEWVSDPVFLDTIEPDICSILNQWLAPAAPWTDWPQVSEICQHLFGEAWCEFALPSLTPKFVSAYVYKERPLFNPKVVLLENKHALNLPSFE